MGSMATDYPRRGLFEQDFRSSLPLGGETRFSFAGVECEHCRSLFLLVAALRLALVKKLLQGNSSSAKTSQISLL